VQNIIIMKEEIFQCLEVVKRGGIILYPTDTVWGIGCDATNEEAVKKIYDLKKRADNKSMLVLVDSMDLVFGYATKIPDIAQQLVELTDKPLTIIYPSSRGLASNLTGENGSIGIRVCADLFSKELIKKMRRPLVSTSANISGEPTPAIFDEIADEIKNGVDYVVKHRQSDKTKASPSSIIKFTEKGEIEIIRK